MKTVRIDADKERNLKFNYNALITLKEDFGLDVDVLANNPSFKDIRTMYYVGLMHEDKELTEEMTGDILDAIIEKHGMEYAGEKLAEAVMKAFGMKESDVKKTTKTASKK